MSTLVWLFGYEDRPAEIKDILINISLQIFNSISYCADFTESTKLIKVHNDTPRIFSTFPETVEHNAHAYSLEWEYYCAQTSP